MPRPPNHKSKTVQIVIIPRPEWETEMRAFREICARNKINMSKELFERGIQDFLKEHNWPPGDSQTVIESFSKPKKGLCQEGCGREATLLVHYEENKVQISKKVCRGCLRGIRRKHGSIGYRKLKKDAHYGDKTQ